MLLRPASRPYRLRSGGWRRGIKQQYKRADVIASALFLAPAVVILSIFVVYPILTAAYTSLTSWNGFDRVKEFVGFENYKTLSQSGEFWNSLLVTVLYALGVCALSVISGIAIALLLDGPLRGRSFYRSIYFLPTVTSSVAVAIVWRYMLDSSGFVNNFLDTMGIAGPAWLQDRWLALAILTLMTVWKNLGLNIVLYLTALQALPRGLYEAAALDGAGAFTQIRRITVPLLHPMTFFVVIQALITSFQAFDLVYVLTGGGPQGGTEVMGMLMYREAFRLNRVGYGTAISFVALVVMLIIAAVQWKATRAGESELR